MTQFFIGVDGGGTSCRAALATGEGTVVGEGRSGAANIMTDVDGAVVHIVQAASDACRSAGVDPDILSSAHAVLGLAGANVEATVTTAKRQLPFQNSVIETDALIAAHGALADGDGAIAVLGTGSVFAQKRGEDVRTIGGWGLILGDQGAGAALGRSLLREALLAFDGVRDGSALTERALNDFQNDPRALSAFAHDAVPGQFARYAPLVFEYADQGDLVAVRVLKQAAAEVDESLRVVLQGTDGHLCLLGGLGPLYEPWLADEHRQCVHPPVGDALSGATNLAVKRFSAEARVHG
ncbi:MAG: N-acetylglucosamine kinase [Alphaproteobacteria bacterium]|nr:N-acetylglucosamine kinase [Alphaproteobacteria bacterium]